MKELIIGKNDAGQRADKFLQKACPALPKSAMYKYIRKKSIKLNGKRLDIAQKLNEGDALHKRRILRPRRGLAELPFRGGEP